MIHIKYKLDVSDIHGIGLFIDQDIKKGKLVYSSSPDLDVNITDKKFKSLNKKEQQEIKYWGFWDNPNKVWHVDFDVSKFINHAYTPNLSQDMSHQDAYLITTRAIKKGEELTQNYREIESEKDLRQRGIK